MAGVVAGRIGGAGAGVVNGQVAATSAAGINRKFPAAEVRRTAVAEDTGSGEDRPVPVRGHNSINQLEISQWNLHPL